jgi:hypothetical protein
MFSICDVVPLVVRNLAMAIFYEIRNSLAIVYYLSTISIFLLKRLAFG